MEQLLRWLERATALTVPILTSYHLWLSAKKKKLEIEELELENRRKRRGGE